MRWKSAPKPSYLDTKIKTWFAFLPINIEDDYRWLEWVTVEYVFRPARSSIYRMPNQTCYWFKTRFIDN